MTWWRKERSGSTAGRRLALGNGDVIKFINRRYDPPYPFGLVLEDVYETPRAPNPSFRYIPKIDSCEIGPNADLSKFKFLVQEAKYRDVQRIVRRSKPSTTKNWLRLRYQALKAYGNKCQCCGSDGPLCVDHIKPKSKYPELAEELSNLQVLCRDCNVAKSNIDETDWRTP